MITGETKDMTRWEKRLDSAGLLVGVVLLIAHYLAVASLTVNVPFEDEWELFVPGALDNGLNGAWLLEFHNEHRLFFTKLLAWVLLRFGALHLPVQVTVNFAVYTAIAVGLAFVARQRLRVPAAPIVAVLAAPMATEVHFWSFQSHFHFYILFFALALVLLLRKDVWSWLSVPLCAAAALSFSAGVICGAACVAATSVLAWMWTDDRRRLSAQAVVCALVLGAWFVGYPGHLEGHPPFSSPFGIAFWRHFATMLARGFAYEGRHLVQIGIVIVIALTAVIGWSLWRAIRYRDATWLMVCVFVLGILAGLASVSVARGGFGRNQGASPRYLEAVGFIVAGAWMLFAHALRRTRVAVWLGSVCIIVPFINELHFVERYKPMRGKFLAAERCVARYFSGVNDGHCPEAYPLGSIATRLEYARRLGVSFAVEGAYLATKSEVAEIAAGPTQCLASARVTIDRLNDVEGKARVEAKSDQHLRVVGWAFTDNSRVPSIEVAVDLRRADGAGYRVPAEREARPDVASVFGNDDLTSAGFMATAAIRGIAPGSYSVAVYQRGDGDESVCDSGYVLEVR